MDVTAQALRYFVALSEEGHFGRAAARLHVTTPSLSEQIARLEKKIRADLFVRSPRGVELTEAGRELLPLARAVTRRPRGGLLVGGGPSDASGLTVRVGVFAALAAPLRATSTRLSPTCIRIRRCAPGGRSALVVRMLRDERIDLAYLPEPLPGTPRVSAGSV